MAEDKESLTLDETTKQPTLMDKQDDVQVTENDGEDADYEYVYEDEDDTEDDAQDGDADYGEGEYVYADEEADAADDEEYEYVYVDEDEISPEDELIDGEEYEEVAPSQESSASAETGAAATASTAAAVAGAAAAGAAATAQEKEETPEERLAREKKAKHDRIRRNLRILALAVAAYYFVSAGYSWYQENQAENAKEASAMVDASVHATQLFADPVAFRERFNDSINAQRSSLPTANANDSTEGFVAVLSPAIELRGVIPPDAQDIAYMQLQTRYPDALPPESITALRAFVLACENATDQKQADEILNALGIIPTPDANEAGKVFAPTMVQSPGVRYELSFVDDAIDELTIKAFPRK